MLVDFEMKIYAICHKYVFVSKFSYDNLTPIAVVEYNETTSVCSL